jgi:hypothetical protein
MNTRSPDEDRVLEYIEDFYSNSAVDNIPQYLCGQLLDFFERKVKVACSGTKFSAMNRQRVIEFLRAIVKINMEISLNENILQLIANKGIEIEEWQ